MSKNQYIYVSVCVCVCVCICIYIYVTGHYYVLYIKKGGVIELLSAVI